jgi:SPX domain protein involved in polyphosphate accumulation
MFLKKEILINLIYDFIFRALRRWETLKNEAIHVEHSRRHTLHRPVVTSPSNTADSDQTTGAITTDGAKSTSVKRRSVHNEERNVMTPLARVLPERLVERTREKQSERIQYRKRNDLKLAFSEFYLMLILLQNYQTLNYTGFRKILKKHDKLFETTRGDEWR